MQYSCGGDARRRGCSTEDAIFLARRRIELARAQRNGSVSLLALDWAKAFDSINPASLLDALRRAGLPEAFLQMIDGMLRRRKIGHCGRSVHLTASSALLRPRSAQKPVGGIFSP